MILSKNNSVSFIASGLIKTDPAHDMALRLNHIHNSLTEVLNQYRPDEASIEETFINVNPLSSLKLGHARGALMLSLGIFGVKVFEYSTTSIKKTVVGVGRAEKNQVAMMMKILLPGANLKTEDEADAAAAAICHNNWRGSALR